MIIIAIITCTMIITMISFITSLTMITIHFYFVSIEWILGCSCKERSRQKLNIMLEGSGADRGDVIEVSWV